MLILEDCFVDVVGHVQGEEAIYVVPSEHNANEKGASPINRDAIVFLEGLLEVLHV